MRLPLRRSRLLATAEVLATLDVLTSFAELAAVPEYVRPESLPMNPACEIRDGRHPVLDVNRCRPGPSCPTTST